MADDLLEMVKDIRERLERMEKNVIDIRTYLTGIEDQAKQHRREEGAYSPEDLK